jgi:lantibiotic modifying enzyme
MGGFVEDFCNGFKGQLVKISEQKYRWLGDHGLLRTFRDCQRRFVPRPTWLYVWLRKQLVEPGALKSEIYQRLTLEHLARSYLVSASGPRNWPLFASEAAQMRNLDVPFFEHSITGLELVLPDGLNIDDYLEVSGYENARHNIEGLDLGSIDFQVKLIHGLIAAKSIHSDHAVQRCSSLSDSVLLDELSVNGPLGEAKAVGDLLVGTSISYEKGAVEWLGLDITEDFESSRYGPLELSLYFLQRWLREMS